MSKPIALAMVSEARDMRVAPLALLYIGGYLKKNGYDIEVFHISEHNIEKGARDIYKINPLFVGVSSITGNQTKHSALLSKALKEIDNKITIMWGGVHPSLLPLQCAKENYIDYVAVGEGEETTLELAQALEGKRDIKTVKGIVYQDEQRIIMNEKRPLQDNIDKYEIDFSLIDLEKHLDFQWGCDKILSFITSRGCPFDCAFCFNLRFNERKWRPHSAERVINQVNELKDTYNIDGVRFYDDLLFSNPKRALDLIKGIGLPWYGEVRIGMVNEKFVDNLIETHAMELLFGLESGSDRMLRLINKMQTVETIKRGTRLLKRAKGTRVVGSFILGMPTETQEETFETIDLILELSKLHPNMRFSAGFYMPYPGSDLYHLALEKGFEPPKRTEDWDQLDRWDGHMELKWLDWQKNSDYFTMVRDYVNLLPLRDLDLPVISGLPDKRLKVKDFSHEREIAFLRNLQKQYAVKDTVIGKVGRKVLPYLKA